MAQTTSKLENLKALRASLIDCLGASWNTADEWITFYDFLDEVNDMISVESRNCGFMSVYPIVDGMAGDSLFEGTLDQCKTFSEFFLEKNPEMKGNLIIV